MPRPQADDDAESEAESKAVEALRARCLLVASGKAPLDTLPSSCRKVLEDSRAIVNRVLAATHTEVGGLPAGAGSLSRPEFSLQPSGMRALEHVVELAALETLLQVAEGHSEEAVDTCLDALAVSRELSLGGGLYGSKLSARCQDFVYRPCAVALDAAPVERKRRALSQLSRLREGFPSPSAILREEAIFQQLTTFGPEFLPSEALARLPPAGRALVVSRGGWFYSSSRIGHPVLRRYVWRRDVALFDAMVAVADLPPDERQRAFAHIDAGEGLLAGYPGMVSAQEYHRELEHLGARRLQASALTALVEVDITRAEQGHWPTTFPPDVEKQFSLEVLDEEEARLILNGAGSADLALSLSADRVP